jgi:hypothetical protein
LKVITINKITFHAVRHESLGIGTAMLPSNGENRDKNPEKTTAAENQNKL